MRIDRCVCHNRTFRELRDHARETGARTVEALQDHVSFGTGCGLCRPYVQAMLVTGQTVFSEVIPASNEPPVDRDGDRLIT